MTHLTPDELIDAMEGMVSPERQRHLASCEACQRALGEVSGVLNEARLTSVPEPSPLFWPHFSARVRAAIDQDGAAAGPSPSWFRWQILAPVGVMLMLILSLSATVPWHRGPDVTVDESSLDLELVEDSWSALADLVGHIDVETASAAGVIEPGVAERAVLDLTTEEQQELTRLLTAELMRVKS